MTDFIYRYAVLQVTPDMRRGERINIGLVVFKPDGLDVRVTETRKIRAVAAGSWDSEIEAFTSILRNIDDVEVDGKERLRASSIIENQFSMRKTGWFRASSGAEYELTVRDITESMIIKPRVIRHPDNSTVVAEISRELRKADILASKDDQMESGKVFRGYAISPELEADFAQLNSAFHVAAVLDLRSSRPQLAQAALKAIVLDQAKAAYPDRKVHKIGVFAAAPARMAELRDNLAILRPYADDLYNWQDEHDQRQLKRVFYDAYNAHHKTLLSGSV